MRRLCAAGKTCMRLFEDAPLHHLYLNGFVPRIRVILSSQPCCRRIYLIFVSVYDLLEETADEWMETSRRPLVDPLILQRLLGAVGN